MTSKLLINPGTRNQFAIKSGFVVIWEFRIQITKRRAFELAYGVDGDWAQLFRKERGYVGTDLVRDPQRTDRYITLDFWKSREDYERFKSRNRTIYQLIDEKCEALTTRETEIGGFSRHDRNETSPALRTGKAKS